MPDNDLATTLAESLLASGTGDISTASILMTAVFSSFVAVRLLRGSWTRHPADLVIAIMGGVVAAALITIIPNGLMDDPISRRLAILGGAFLFAFAFREAMQAA